MNAGPARSGTGVPVLSRGQDFFFYQEPDHENSPLQGGFEPG